MLFRMYDMGKASHAHAQNWVHLKFLVLKSFSKKFEKSKSRPIKKMHKRTVSFWRPIVALNQIIQHRNKEI